MKVTVAFAGKKSTSEQHQSLVKSFEKQMGDAIKKGAAEMSEQQAKAFSRAVWRLGRSENQKVFLTIAKMLQNKREPSINTSDMADTYLPQVVDFSFNIGRPSPALGWPPHMPNTPWRKKKDLKDPKSGVKPDSVNKYFYRTGALREFFRKNATGLGQRLGNVKVTYKDQKGRFMSARAPKGPVASVTVAFMYNVQKNTLPGVLAGDWTITDPSLAFERKFIQDPEVMKKLEGHIVSGTRPLVQPVINYFLLYRFPQLIYNIMKRELARKPRAQGNFWG